MKITAHPSGHCRSAGSMLIEMLVYFFVFTILMSVGFASFYLCWDHTRATIYATDDISASLRAGEQWRADVRAASGKITVESSPTNEIVRLSSGGKDIVYRYVNGEVRRDIPAANVSRLLLQKVKTSQMTTEMRDGVTAWKWELEVIARRPETQLPEMFTFEAAQLKP